MLALKAVILVLATAGIVYLSRSCVLDPRSHGFYRAFFFEATVVLTLLNLDVWFRDPFSWHQIVSWILLAICIVPVVHGAFLLKLKGNPGAQRTDAGLIGIEKTSALVTVGAYRIVRHPIYSSGLYGAWGIFFKDPSWMGGLLALVATLFLVATAKVEEAENIRYFGPAYAEYMKRTKMFIPYVF